MSSKLDYLSKYLDNNDDDDDSRKKKDQKKKKKKAKKKNQPLRNERLVVQDDDDDDVWRLGENKDDAEDEEEEDGPMVVNEVAGHVESDMQMRPRGQWQTVADNTPKAANAPKTTSTRQRYDSSSEDEDRVEVKRRPRYDSDDEDTDKGNAGTSSDHSPRRRRYDSSSSLEADEKEASVTQRKSKRQRYDSSDDEDKGSRKANNTRMKKKRYDSDSSSSSSRADYPTTHNGTRPIKSESDNESSQKKTDSKRRRRYDSDEEDDHDEAQNKRKIKKRHDDDSSVDDEDRKSREERMSSGHRAGLQTGKGFSEAEADIQRKRHAEAQEMVDKYGMGETVHRGNRLSRDKKKPGQPLTAEQQAELNRGKYQKEKAEREQEQFARIQQSEFARWVDDDEIETLRKQAIREGDPMAQYAGKQSTSKKSKGSSAQQLQVPSRPVYKGPPPKPNRFGIRPGFRWDGNDRGNGFEDRLLAQRSSQSHRQEEAYRWSSAGM